MKLNNEELNNLMYNLSYTKLTGRIKEDIILFCSNSPVDAGRDLDEESFKRYQNGGYALRDMMLGIEKIGLDPSLVFKQKLKSSKSK